MCILTKFGKDLTIFLNRHYSVSRTPTKTLQYDDILISLLLFSRDANN